MNTNELLWEKLRSSKAYREEIVAAQLKRGIPFQIRTMLNKAGISQEELAERSGLTQGVVSRAANPNYGNLTLNTIIRIAAGFDVAFMGRFVPFSELGDWFSDLTEEGVLVASFVEEDRPSENDLLIEPTGLSVAAVMRKENADLQTDNRLRRKDLNVVLGGGIANELKKPPQSESARAA